MKLANFVRRIIIERDYRSVRAAARSIKYDDGRPMSNTTLKSILDGKKNIDTSTLRAIARWAGVPTRYLFDMLDSDDFPMPHERVLSAIIAVDEDLRDALLNLAEAIREDRISNEDIKSIADFIKYKVS